MSKLQEGGQNIPAERAWKILRVKNINGYYMNTRNWNSARKNLNKYNLTKNQKNIVILANALIKAGKPPGGGNRHRIHPNTLRQFNAGTLTGNKLVNQMKRNSNARGGYKGRMFVKGAGVAALGVGAYMATPHVKALMSKYGPGVVDFLRKRANFAENGALTNSEINNLAANWKRRGFEIKNMKAFAGYVRAGGNASNPNRAAAAFNKAFKNGVVSMVAGGAASSLGAAALGGGSGAAASRVAAARNAFANVGRQAVRLRAPNTVRTQMLNQAARQVAKNQGMTFTQGLQASRRMTNSTRAGLNRVRMARPRPR